MEKPPCDDCTNLHAPDAPPCDTCMVELMEENSKTFEVYSRTHTQCIGEAGAINILAIQYVCSLLGVEDQLEMIDRIARTHNLIRGTK